MRRSILTVLLIFFLISCHQKKNTREKLPEISVTPAGSLTAALREIQKDGQINGFSVAIVNMDSVLYTAGIGYADIEKKTAYTENTLQNIASISKTLIGIALLKAQEMGKLKLDDPINNYLPYEVKNPYFPSEPITIRHLATHTSTISDTEVYDEQSYVLKTKQDSLAAKHKKIPENFNPPEKKISMTEFLQNILHVNGKWYTKAGFLNKKPGELFEYSNVGATLAASVIEYATGENYSEFTSKHILKPLGMDSSGWSFDEIDLKMHTKLYTDPDTQIPFYSLITYPDGGFITSGHDLSTYLVELIRGYAGNGSLLTRDSYAELFTKQLNADNFTERDATNPYNDEYNMGIFMGFSARGYVGHTGGDPGVASFMFFNPEKKTGRILMINTAINNEEGVQQFIAIWNTLEEYQEKLN